MTVKAARIWHFSIIGSLAVISVTSLALRSLTVSFTSQQAPNLNSLRLNRVEGTPIIHALPAQLYSDKLRLISLLITLVDAICALILATFAWSMTNKVRPRPSVVRKRSNKHKVYRVPPCRGYPVMLTVNSLAALAATSWVWKVHYSSAHFNPAYHSPAARNGTVDQYGVNNVYDAGTFDLETWTCELAAIRPDIFAPTCRVEIARRWAMLVFAAFTLASIATASWAYTWDRRLITARRREKREEKQWQENRKLAGSAASTFGYTASCTSAGGINSVVGKAKNGGALHSSMGSVDTSIWSSSVKSVGDRGMSPETTRSCKWDDISSISGSSDKSSAREDAISPVQPSQNLFLRAAVSPVSPVSPANDSDMTIERMEIHRLFASPVWSDHQQVV
jgi:hypothetical protein